MGQFGYNGQVSIIVPVYNAGNTLDACIDSICAQSYDSLQIILVDDGSSDGSVEICRAWQDRDARIAVICQDNRGVSAARNAGVAIAQGEFIMFVDADDWLEKMCIEEALRHHDQGQLTIFGYYADRRDMRSTKQRGRTVRHSKSSADALLKVDAVSLFDEGLFGSVWNKIYERSLIKANELAFEENTNLGEDVIFNLAYLGLSSIKGITMVNMPLYHYRENNVGSLDNSFNDQFIAYQERIFSDFYSLLTKEGASQKELSHLRSMELSAYFVAIDNAYVHQDACGSGLYKRRISEMKELVQEGGILRELRGARRVVGLARWALLLSHGYMVDLHVRNAVKRLLRRA